MSTREENLVSVIIPVYNGAAYLSQAIDNVLAQVPAPLEVVIVDDGSSDATPAVAARYGDRVRTLRQDNRGASAARNAGLRIARGNLIAFLDADDLWSADKLKLQLEALEKNPSYDIIQGLVQDMRGNFVDGQPAFAPFWIPQVRLSMGAAIIRKSVFDRVGPFDESMRSVEDVDWYFRALEKGMTVLVVKSTILYYRKHPGSTSFGDNLKTSGFLKEIQRSLCRRREASAGPLPPLQRWTFYDPVSGHIGH